MVLPTLVLSHTPGAPRRMGMRLSPTTAAAYSADRSNSARVSVVKRVLQTLSVWRRRAAQRRALSQLDERLLADIGLTLADVDREVRKPFWYS